MDNLKTKKLSYSKFINNQLDSYRPISFRLLAIKDRFKLSYYEYVDLINKRKIEFEREEIGFKANYVLRLEGSTLIIENNLTVKQPLEYIEL